ncbi:MAG: hypothetical protein P0107_01085 [Nitrosomonas sp.]|nr:hypothetical protein [Nitrosomonas sp.]
MMAVALIASALWEGLPAIMTVTLALGVQYGTAQCHYSKIALQSRHWDQ